MCNVSATHSILKPIDLPCEIELGLCEKDLPLNLQVPIPVRLPGKFSLAKPFSGTAPNWLPRRKKTVGDDVATELACCLQLTSCWPLTKGNFHGGDFERKLFVLFKSCKK